jgi:hypothetical protein
VQHIKAVELSFAVSWVVVCRWPVMPRTGGELFIHAKAARRDVLYAAVTTFVDFLGDDVRLALCYVEACASPSFLGTLLC